ncbi:MAG: GNAT family N-acetyltransferase [Candidatus Helarchaeota archaeon]
MSIRNVQVKDKFEIAALAEACVPWLRASVVGTYEFLARCFSNTFFVYEEQGKIIGFIVGFPNTAVKGEFWLYQVGIYEEYRGRGIGSKLLARLIEQVKAEGYACMRSHFKFENKHSRALHEKFGMKVCGQDDRGWFVEVKFEN